MAKHVEGGRIKTPFGLSADERKNLTVVADIMTREGLGDGDSKKNMADAVRFSAERTRRSLEKRYGKLKKEKASGRIGK